MSSQPLEPSGSPALTRSTLIQILDSTVFRESTDLYVSAFSKWFALDQHFSWCPNGGLQIEFPQDFAFRRMSRAPPEEIIEELTPKAVDDNTQPRSKGKSFLWWLAQCMHYDLGFVLTVSDAKFAFHPLVSQNRLKIPKRLRKLEKRLKKEFENLHPADDAVEHAVFEATVANGPVPTEENNDVHDQALVSPLESPGSRSIRYTLATPSRSNNLPSYDSGQDSESEWDVDDLVITNSASSEKQTARKLFPDPKDDTKLSLSDSCRSPAHTSDSESDSSHFDSDPVAGDARLHTCDHFPDSHQHFSSELGIVQSIETDENHIATEDAVHSSPPGSTTSYGSSQELHNQHSPAPETNDPSHLDGFDNERSALPDMVSDDEYVETPLNTDDEEEDEDEDEEGDNDGLHDNEQLTSSEEEEEEGDMGQEYYNKRPEPLVPHDVVLDEIPKVHCQPPSDTATGNISHSTKQQLPSVITDKASNLSDGEPKTAFSASTTLTPSSPEPCPPTQYPIFSSNDPWPGYTTSSSTDTSSTDSRASSSASYMTASPKTNAIQQIDDATRTMSTNKTISRTPRMPLLAANTSQVPNDLGTKPKTYDAKRKADYQDSKSPATKRPRIEVPSENDPGNHALSRKRTRKGDGPNGHKSITSHDTFPSQPRIVPTLAASSGKKDAVKIRDTTSQTGGKGGIGDQKKDKADSSKHNISHKTQSSKKHVTLAPPPSKTTTPIILTTPLVTLPAQNQHRSMTKSEFIEQNVRRKPVDRNPRLLAQSDSLGNLASDKFKIGKGHKKGHGKRQRTPGF